MTNTRTLKPVAYFRATKGHGIVWGEDCCCEDAIFDGDDNYDEQETFSLPVYSADVVEALQKENENLAYRLNNAQDSAIKALEDNAAQEKRIAELEAATEYQDTCTDGGKCGAGGYCKDCIQEPTKDE